MFSRLNPSVAITCYQNEIKMTQLYRDQKSKKFRVSAADGSIEKKIISLPSELVIYKKLLLPLKMSQQDIFAYLKFASRDLFFNDFDQFAIDFYVETLQQQKAKEVHVYLSRRVDIDDYLEKAGAAKHQVMLIEPEIQSLYRLHSWVYRKKVKESLIYWKEGWLFLILMGGQKIQLIQQQPFLITEGSGQLMDFLEILLLNYPQVDFQKIKKSIKQSIGKTGLIISQEFSDIDANFSCSIMDKDFVAIGAALKAYE